MNQMINILVLYSTNMSYIFDILVNLDIDTRIPTICMVTFFAFK